MSWQGPYRDTPTGPAAVHTVPGQWPTDQPKGILASRTAGQATTWDGTPTSSQSYRDVQELLTKRGVEVDHLTVDRWVLRVTPLLADAARPCRHPVGDRWQVDETYGKVADSWR